VTGLNSHPNAHAAAGSYTNAPQIAAKLDRVGVRAAFRSNQLVRHHSMLLETKIKANASGRPGPRARTGDYRRSWTTRVTSQSGTTTATVGTDKPQARRLEYGFVGADRIGRVFNQPPFPHVGPAVDEIGPAYYAAMRGLGGWSDDDA
jgi:hypothetical protein